MIRHVVMFKLKDLEDETTRKEAKEAIKDKLEALPGKIPEIHSMEVGINIIESERAFDLVLISSFNSPDDLEVYRLHPEHQEVVEFIGRYRKQSAAVDFVC